MPTIHRIGATTIRVNTPDHLPPHVHVVLADGRDCFVHIDTLQVIRSPKAKIKDADIADALAWIAANRATCHRVFKECNP